MIRILRELARAFSTYRRWHAGVAKGLPSDAPRDGRRGRTAARARPQASVPRPEAAVAVVRRVRCLSEPCGNARLALALARTRRVLEPTSDIGTGR